MKHFVPKKLPPYVVINDPSCKKKGILRVPTTLITFPIDEETQDVIRQLEAKFDAEESCAGLAAPQIGYSKRVIILEANDEELKQYREDFTDMLPKSIWINPSFKPVSKKKTIDWEACFSVDEILYEAWTPDGKKVKGRVKGFLARLIQHEIDHLNGILFIDHIPEDQLVPREVL